MIIKNLATTSSIVLALSTFLATNVWANSTEESAPAEPVECVTQDGVDAMSDDEKEKNELPICIDEEKEEPSDK